MYIYSYTQTDIYTHNRETDRQIILWFFTIIIITCMLTLYLKFAVLSPTLVHYGHCSISCWYERAHILDPAVAALQTYTYQKNISLTLHVEPSNNRLIMSQLYLNLHLTKLQVVKIGNLDWLLETGTVYERKHKGLLISATSVFDKKLISEHMYIMNFTGFLTRVNFTSIIMQGSQTEGPRKRPWHFH